MIIDAHGHYTTTPPGVAAWRDAQTAALADGAPAVEAAPGGFDVSDDEIRESIESAQLTMQRDRGIDLTLFSPRASWMGHHVGTEVTSRDWTRRQNDLIHRVCTLFPENFAPVAQLPQSPGASIEGSVAELRRCVEELGFVGCNINPDPSGGSFTGPSLADPYWWPLWEAMEELDVPGMVHVSAAANPVFQTTGSYYLSADTLAFVQALTSGFLPEHPGVRLIIPHGGGAIPYHWGRFQGMAQDQGWDFDATVQQLWFDTCVYHQAGIDLLLRVVPTDHVLFGSEMIGAVRGVDPSTGHHWDDTGRYLEAADLTPEQRRAIYSENTLRVFPRLSREGAAA
jgi:4-oxalmesaconate hydratase